MPSFKSIPENDQCIINVIVTQVADEKVKIAIEELQKNTYRALIDTGAQKTCISENVAHKLLLVSKGKSSMISVSEVTSANTYHIDLYIPISQTQPIIQGERVVGLTQDLNLRKHTKLFVSEIKSHSQDFDVLLGMDVLKQCIFIFSHNEFVLGY